MNRRAASRRTGQTNALSDQGALPRNETQPQDPIGVAGGTRWRIRVMVLLLLFLAVSLKTQHQAVAQEKNDAELNLPAPKEWTGEIITLPPGFARDMSVKGTESIRFAPGMFKPDSDSFFSYVFVFRLESKPKLTQKVLADEFLKYYRGLSKAVLRDAAAGVDFSKFTLKLSEVKEPESSTAARGAQAYSGKLVWVEPFASKKEQTLNLQLHTWMRKDKNYVFVCVSPAADDAAIWKQLKKIRSDYFARGGVEPAE